jgi:hypothetical protein
MCDIEASIGRSCLVEKNESTEGRSVVGPGCNSTHTSLGDGGKTGYGGEITELVMRILFSARPSMHMRNLVPSVAM